MNSGLDPKRIEYLFNDLQKKFKGKNKKEQIIKYIDDKNFYAKESPLFKGYIIGPVSEEEREELKKLVDMTELERRRYLNICNMEVRDKNIGEKLGFLPYKVESNAWQKNGVPITSYMTIMPKERFKDLYSYGSKSK